MIMHLSPTSKLGYLSFKVYNRIDGIRIQNIRLKYFTGICFKRMFNSFNTTA